jgi:hypothetical protein
MSDKHSCLEKGDQFSHVCEDGHRWTEQPDGGVSPSWGFGLTSIKYEAHDPRTCPEPERGHSRYEGSGPYHGYQCPTCGAVHYIGGCLMGVRCDPWNGTDCEPPPIACGKPSLHVRRWDSKQGGWVSADPDQTDLGAQAVLF